MSYETVINELIKVWVLFDPLASSGQALFPIAIQWQRRLIKFERLIFASSKKIGEIKVINLVCASDSANFELEYNSENHLWKLRKVMPKE